MIHAFGNAFAFSLIISSAHIPTKVKQKSTASVELPMTMSDYGYEDAEPDYGYGDSSPDYGYGDAKPNEDYGYGDAKPDEDYGYGDAKPDEDYGYGDAKPNEDFGYGDAKPDDAASAPAAPAGNRRPKRRCSVTKYSLEESKGSQEQEMVQQLNAAQMLENFRNGVGIEQQHQPQQRSPPTPTDSGYSTDGKSSETVMTAVSNDDEDPVVESKSVRKTGAMAKLRKRLSIFN